MARLFLFILLLCVQPLKAEATKPYLLESIELQGTARITLDILQDYLDLYRGLPLSEDLIMQSRSKLLASGLFRSVLLLLRPGSAPGLAKLRFELEDDPSVLTPLALGGSAALRYSPPGLTKGTLDEGPSYRFNLISRNAGLQLHRASLDLDLDKSGVPRHAMLGYESPRYAASGLRIDARYLKTDPSYRYFRALGFTRKAQVASAMNLLPSGQLLLGLAQFENRSEDHPLLAFPTRIAGPILVLHRETRLRSFIPKEGQSLTLTVLPAFNKLSQSLYQVHVAHTLDLSSYVGTLRADIASLGFNDYSLRGGLTVDLPLPLRFQSEEQASLFGSLLGGLDLVDSIEHPQKAWGGQAALGLRYANPGFIMELTLLISQVHTHYEKRGS